LEMPSPDFKKRAKVAGVLPPGADKHRGGAYVAKVPSVGELCHVMRQGWTPERVIAWIAGLQLGLVTAPQLAMAGVSRREIALRIRRGALH
jgi:hypothetical protein